MKKVLLCIMDGIGITNDKKYNAVYNAKTPVLDNLWKKYPHCVLEASGTFVGLPKGQMGNSEVGHTNIGAGRLVYQSLELINSKIKDKTFFDNEEILKVIKHVKENNSSIHLIGLLSDGGVHSHINHLFALLDMVKKFELKKVYVHIFTDGRDVSPTSGIKYIELLEKYMKKIGIGKIASIGGRYYGMDRDNNFDRIEKCYEAMVIGTEVKEAKEVWKNSQSNGITDEFIIPTTTYKDGLIKDNDGIVFFNFRPDRLRELASVFTNSEYKCFDRNKIDNLLVVTMMPSAHTVLCPYAFELPKLNNTLGEYISKMGFTQLRIAETEKYAHVTYFFDGGIEKDLKGCKRVLINSPKVATYDLKPEMSAYEITDKLLEIMDDFDVVILNYANGDMVGHTGDIPAAIKAVETVDECVGRIYKKVKELDGKLIVTADHGNCDWMLDDDGNVITSHSTSLVPFIITDKNIELKDGKLADIAPTILNMLDIEIPSAMTGEVLIKK